MKTFYKKATPSERKAFDAKLLKAAHLVISSMMEYEPGDFHHEMISACWAEEAFKHLPWQLLDDVESFIRFTNMLKIACYQKGLIPARADTQKEGQHDRQNT